MSDTSRLEKAFRQAPVLPFHRNSRYVFFSDCHRGVGSANDNFLKNQQFFFAALKHYYKEGYTYVELGDGDELWENKDLSRIIETHSHIFWLLSRFYRENRLYMLYGNHDMVKAKSGYLQKTCTSYYCESEKCMCALFPELVCYPALILKDTLYGHDIYLTHGHQADAFNSVFWRLSRFLVRYFWKPLEAFGVPDPTSAAKNNRRKEAIEEKLTAYARQKQGILIAGHTHRPSLPEAGEAPYCNTGSCVHPRCVTAIELSGRTLTLVKWCLQVREDLSLSIGREVLAGPVSIDAFDFTDAVS